MLLFTVFPEPMKRLLSGLSIRNDAVAVSWIFDYHDILAIFEQDSSKLSCYFAVPGPGSYRDVH